VEAVTAKGRWVLGEGLCVTWFQSCHHAAATTRLNLQGLRKSSLKDTMALQDFRIYQVLSSKGYQSYTLKECQPCCVP
jgi:hypothetical protein